MRIGNSQALKFENWGRSMHPANPLQLEQWNVVWIRSVSIGNQRKGKKCLFHPSSEWTEYVFKKMFAMNKLLKVDYQLKYSFGAL